MTREEFEQLVSEWLDDPGNEGLRTRIEAAIRDDSSLATVVEEWQRFDTTLQAGLPEPGDVDWGGMRAQIGEAIRADDEQQGDALDQLLRALPSPAGRVHWPQLRARIMSAVFAEDAAAKRQRRRRRLFGGAAALLAAAAALWLALIPGSEDGVGDGPAGLVSVTVSAPTQDAGANDGVAYAQLAVAGDPEMTPQQYFSLEPVRTAPPEDTAVYY